MMRHDKHEAPPNLGITEQPAKRLELTLWDVPARVPRHPVRNGAAYSDGDDPGANESDQRPRAIDGRVGQIAVQEIAEVALETPLADNTVRVDIVIARYNKHLFS